MNTKMKKMLSLFLATVLAFSGICSLCGVAAQIEEEKQYPSIVIPGVFQSEVKMYDDEGNVMSNSDGDEYSAPFFLEGTNDIVKYALKQALLPLGSLLLTQKDFNEKCANAIADTLSTVLMNNIQLDKDGKIVKNIRATKYNTSCANLPEKDVEYILDQIPLQDYIEKVGADKLYFYSYVSTGNMIDSANEVYDLIQIAKEESGMDKVNLIPISQGGSVFDALMQVYEDRGESLADDVHRVAFIVPCADGAAVLGDIFRYGLLDDDDALYGYMFPSLLEEDQEWLAYLINTILRIFPTADLNNILDKAVDTLIMDYMRYSTLMWALIPSEDYPECAEKYLSDEASASIREQTDRFYNAQTKAKDRIMSYAEAGVEFFDIVDYDYELYRICDSWNEKNGDGIIHTSSESFGATAAPVGQSLGDDYVQQDTYCTAPGEHNHLDSTKTVDASTGILCETTFYFKFQDHEKTARNNLIIDIATKILTDDSFTGIYSDENYPQFNYARQSQRMKERIAEAQVLSKRVLTPSVREELNAALDACIEAYESTVMPTDEYVARYEELSRVCEYIRDGKNETPNHFLAFLTKIFKFISDTLLKYFGGKGFSDIILFR